MSESKGTAPSKPGMDFWWDKFCQDHAYDRESEHTSVAQACEFAQWFAQQCAEFGKEYMAEGAVPPKPIMIPVCVCGHLRNHHSIEPPYECNDLTLDCDCCDCESFTYPPS